VAISTDASIRKMLLPGAIAIISPLIIGFMPGLGAEALGGFLAGATVSGVLMGMFQNNAGGAWDNAKKSFEKGVEINGEIFYKKSDPHKASVTGDTVGDPFKDTSGPSMNILIKLMSIVSLVIAPTLAQMSGKSHGQQHETNIQVEVIQEAKPVVESSVSTLVEALIRDGRINADQYRIKLGNDSLFINDVLQPNDVLDTYAPQLNGLTKFQVEYVKQIN
jgi:K(+)-stimulated pyrophosphate-energized sodium pump